MANQTVYPYGTGGSLPSSIGIINDLHTGGADKALSAEMGKYLAGGYEETGDYDLTDYTQFSGLINGSNKWENNATARHILIPLTDIVHIEVAMDGGNGIIAFLKDSSYLDGATPNFSDSYPARIQILDGSSAEYDVPSDANFLYVITKSTSGTDARSFYSIEYTEYVPGMVRKTDIEHILVQNISPELEIGSVTNTGVDNTASFYGTKYWRTSRFVKLYDGNSIGATVNTTAKYLRFAYYGPTFSFLENHDVSTTGTITDTPPDGAAYLRVCFISDTPSSSAFDIPKPTLSLSGNFTEDWDTCLNNPGTSFSILVPVLVSDPDTCEDETEDLQDTQTLLSDTGILALPPTYTPDGNPTRIIIYCHGAGVNYSIGTGTFPSSDIRPELWLAEGYAVMDVEGNPFNDVDEHFYNPTARQCYIAAYEFVTRKYNIRKDGILLGGRSMGGGMVFDLLLSTIPIIAACPLVPGVNTLWLWEYMNAARRQFVAQKMGFTGTAPTWTNNNPMSNSEWQYLQDNFDKFIRYSPFLALQMDTPTKTEIFSVGNIGTSASSTTEAELYGGRHFKCKAPVKMFAVHDDATVNNARNCDLVKTMMLNGAQVVELRYFEDGGHHFEVTSKYLLPTYTTSYGQTLTDVPVVYVEMLAFWRRYEQGL